MRIRSGWMSCLVRRLLLEGNESARAVRPSARLGVEKLEDRLVLSADLPAGPALHAVDPFLPGDAFALAGTSDPTANTAVTKWAQPGGLGSAVTITYSYSNLLDGRVGLTANTVKAAIQEAMSRWAAVAPLRFVEVPDTGPALSATDYIQGTGAMIRFGHLPIDGPGKTLGYAYYPGTTGLGGDVLFDEAENWTTNPATGVDLVEVAEHELGHALGLAHEPPVSAGGLDAIMNPYYAGQFHGLGTSYLFADDINGVRAIYGTGVGSVTAYDPTPITPASIPTPSGFALSGTTLYITGTAGADTVIFSGAGSGSVSLNGIDYGGSLDGVRSIVIDTGAGNDTVSITGSPSAETFALKPGGATVTGPRWNLTVVNAEAIEVYGGAEDRVTFEDAPGANIFVALPTRATLTGAGYSLAASGVGSVSARMVNGGDDDAYLYGSAGTNYFVSTPSMASLYGAGYSITAINFHAVYAYSSSAGGSATLGGSAGDDTVYATPTSTWLLANDGSFTTVATGFLSVAVDPGAGTNHAYLTGSTGDDTVVTAASQVRLSGQGFSLAMNNFQAVTVNGGGGSDSAVLNDPSSNDIFQGSPTIAILRQAADPSRFYRLDGFANVTVNVTNGGHDTAYLNGSPGVDSLIVMAGSTTLSGVGFSIRVNAFENVAVTSVGGQDRVSIYDSPGNDTFTANGRIANMYYPTSQVQLANFAQASVLSTAGGIDKRKVGATSMVLGFWGAWE